MTASLYICAIVLVRTLGRATDDDPNRSFLRSKFGSIPKAMLTLFELMSNPDLSLYHDLFLTHPFAMFFFIGFIIFGSFGMIAVLTGIISEAILDKNQIRIEEERVERENKRKLVERRC